MKWSSKIFFSQNMLQKKCLIWPSWLQPPKMDSYNSYKPRVWMTYRLDIQHDGLISTMWVLQILTVNHEKLEEGVEELR